jgi:hypothetical protein
VRKEMDAIEKAAYLKVYKARAAAAKDDSVAEAVTQKVRVIESAAKTQLAALLSKSYATLFKNISLNQAGACVTPATATLCQRAARCLE